MSKLKKITRNLQFRGGRSDDSTFLINQFNCTDTSKEVVKASYENFRLRDEIEEKHLIQDVKTAIMEFGVCRNTWRHLLCR